MKLIVNKKKIYSGKLYNNNIIEMYYFIVSLYQVIILSMDILANFAHKKDPKQLKDQIYKYDVQSKMHFSPGPALTYGKLLEQYNRQLMTKIHEVASNLFNTPVYMIRVDMQPDNLQWEFWKTQQEMLSFVMSFDDQIDQMQQLEERMSSNSLAIIERYKGLKSMNPSTFDFKNAFLSFINLVGEQPYLRKTIEFLMFIEHCVSVDKWNLKVYKHVEVPKKASLTNKIMRIFSSAQNRDCIATVTNEGIIKSDNHLLESRIRSMVPFTNQMNIEIVVDEKKHVNFRISSCVHEGMFIHFFNKYDQAINFGCALGKALKESSYQAPHRFSSFASMRQNCDSKMYNDGYEYYDDLFEEISRATFEICITGWMITPYFLLRRPGKITDKTYRLDGALNAAAQRGVRVYVIVFMQPKMFVNNDSQNVQLTFEKMHKNITVLRHPNVVIPGLWSHHQKMVVIDQKVGFMGGLDICYGRWDTPDHYLYDPGQFWDGAEYNNYRTSDIYTPRDFQHSNLNKSFQPRMGWHDIAIQLRGDSVIDLLRHFVQYWYFVKHEISYDPFKSYDAFKKRISGALSAQTFGTKMEVQYYKKYMKQNQTEINSNLNLSLDSWKKKVSVFFYGDQVVVNQLFIKQPSGQKCGPQRHQICRSASNWSIGIQLNSHEHSIHNAYIQLIQMSEKFIYIENQFFMGLENKVVQKLAQRIRKAYNKGQKFKLIVVMPLLPAFEGDITKVQSTVLRIQVHYQYQAINRGQNSLYKRLKDIPNLDDYFFFFGLRQSAIIRGVPVTQIIYVHSKLMIVDDNRCIIGSANINDRSLLGNRDSQLAVIVEEQAYGKKIFNLRARLFQQHFALNEQETAAIMSPQVWGMVLNNAKKNTLIYRQVFGCLPDDTVSLSAQAQKFEATANILKYHELKDQIVGHAVEFPLKFMQCEDLTFKFGQKQYMAPDSSFT